MVKVEFYEGKAMSVELPATVDLTVMETEPGMKGATVSNVTKPAKLERGWWCSAVVHNGRREDPCEHRRRHVPGAGVAEGSQPPQGRRQFFLFSGKYGSQVQMSLSFSTRATTGDRRRGGGARPPPDPCIGWRSARWEWIAPGGAATGEGGTGNDFGAHARNAGQERSARARIPVAGAADQSQCGHVVPALEQEAAEVFPRAW